jgi:hypothetical protein
MQYLHYTTINLANIPCFMEYWLNIHDHTMLEIIKIISASGNKFEVESDWRNYLEKEKANKLCERKN